MNASRSPSPAVAASESKATGLAPMNSPNDKKLRIARVVRRNRGKDVISASTDRSPSSRPAGTILKSCEQTESQTELSTKAGAPSTLVMSKPSPDTDKEVEKSTVVVSATRKDCTNTGTEKASSYVARDRIRTRDGWKLDDGSSYEGRRVERPKPTLEHSRAMSRLYSQRNRDKQKSIIEELNHAKALLEQEKEELLHEHQQLESLLRTAQYENQNLREVKLTRRIASASESHRKIVEAFLGEGMANVPPESWSVADLSTSHAAAMAAMDVTQSTTSSVSSSSHPPFLNPLLWLQPPSRSDSLFSPLSLGREQPLPRVSASQSVQPQVSSLQHLQRLQMYNEWQQMRRQIDSQRPNADQFLTSMAKAEGRRKERSTSTKRPY